MKLHIQREYKKGKFIVRLAATDFSDDEIFMIVRYGPLAFQLPTAHFSRLSDGLSTYGSLELPVAELGDYDFSFPSKESAQAFIDAVTKAVQRELEKLATAVSDFVGKDVFEIRAGEEVKRINEGAKKALDRSSTEYKEVIEKNREAFEKLSKL